MEDGPAGFDAFLASRVFIRLAGREDVRHILGLIRELAEFEKLLDECVATEDGLTATLFALPPFQGPTVMMLEVAAGAADAAAAAAATPLSAREEEEEEEEKAEALEHPLTVEDPDRKAYASARGGGRVVAGFVLFFPNYSTFLGKAGIYIEDLFVRAPYRRLGLGTRLLSHVAQKGVSRGAGRVEWSVLDWNEKAISFYEKRMGATLMKGWTVCRLTGPALAAAAQGR